MRRLARGYSSRRSTSVLALALLLGSLVVMAPVTTRASTVPGGFRDTIVLDGLTNPTTVRFARDGRIFVAEKSGLIKVFDGLSDTSPTTFADLRTNVHNFWDRGLLGLALDPDFPTRPFVYALYTYDAPIGGVAPRWGTVGGTSDGCPKPPGANDDGCVVSGRLSRLEADGNVMAGGEKVLIEDWCQQYPSHSIGTLAFGSDGALYVSAGDGASFEFTDYGQEGDPLNPCGDPPAGVGGVQTPPTAQGGTLRSQDLRTSGDPVTLDGAILRVDPATGAALPDNPLYDHPDPNAQRIIAYGLRNPFRFTIRPGSNNLYVGDVGSIDYEEINRIANPTDATVENFGWPCYEGSTRQPAFDAANLDVCENLYGQSGAVKKPFFKYHHDAQVVSGDACPVGSSSLSGVAFGWYGGGPYPPEYDGTLFFADYSRDCIWAMLKGDNGLPSPSRLRTFVTGADNPVDVQISPAGELFYVDFLGGTIHRIQYFGSNSPPVAVAQADRTSGEQPLTVKFDGTASSDPDPGDTLAYAWDLDGDGAFDDSTTAQPSMTYEQEGTYSVRLQVSDDAASDISDPLVISVGNTPPTATVEAPSASTTWTAEETIAFSGTAADGEDATLPDSSFSWSLNLHHCPSNCHVHPLQDFAGVRSGSFVAPDHEYPSHLELRLTVSDSGGLSDSTSVLLDPQTVTLDFDSSPRGLELVVGNSGGTTPFGRTVIVGSSNSISAPSPQTAGGTIFSFSSWSDGGAATHNIAAPENAATYTATYSSDDTQLILSDVAATEIGRTSAVITWTTNQPADSRVQYGKTSGYGSTKKDLDLVTTHSVKISNLSPKTLYHYRAKSKNAGGTLRSSPDFTFRTGS